MVPRTNNVSDHFPWCRHCRWGNLGRPPIIRWWTFNRFSAGWGCPDQSYDRAYSEARAIQKNRPSQVKQTACGGSSLLINPTLFPTHNGAIICPCHHGEYFPVSAEAGISPGIEICSHLFAPECPPLLSSGDQSPVESFISELCQRDETG